LSIRVEGGINAATLKTPFATELDGRRAFSGFSDHVALPRTTDLTGISPWSTRALTPTP
jgi:hypothetical protein